MKLLLVPNDQCYRSLVSCCLYFHFIFSPLQNQKNKNKIQCFCFLVIFNPCCINRFTGTSSQAHTGHATWTNAPGQDCTGVSYSPRTFVNLDQLRFCPRILLSVGFSTSYNLEKKNKVIKNDFSFYRFDRYKCIVQSGLIHLDRRDLYCSYIGEIIWPNSHFIDFLGLIICYARRKDTCGYSTLQIEISKKPNRYL